MTTGAGEGRALLDATTVILGLWAVVTGVLTIVGGAERWASPAYRAALLLPGAPESWGITILIAGLVLLTGAAIRNGKLADQLTVAGSLLGFSWTFCLGAAVCKAALENTAVSFVGVVNHWTFALLFAVFGIYVWRNRR